MNNLSLQTKMKENGTKQAKKTPKEPKDAKSAVASAKLITNK